MDVGVVGVGVRVEGARVNRGERGEAGQEVSRRLVKGEGGEAMQQVSLGWLGGVKTPSGGLGPKDWVEYRKIPPRVGEGEARAEDM